MHTKQLLQHFFKTSLLSSHKARLTALISSVNSVCQGAKVSITSMGRNLFSPIKPKHAIKKIDRLVGNQKLFAERGQFYKAMCEYLLRQTKHPVILIDWSVFSKDGKKQLLRAALPMKGRSLTLYEELHPIKNLGNRDVQHRFLLKLKDLLPSTCRPIIVADSGFRVPFYQAVEALDWDWVGRIQNNDYIFTQENSWIKAKSLYSLATSKPAPLGSINWTKSHAHSALAVLIRKKKQGRKSQTHKGNKRRSAQSKKNARRERSPWLLVASRSLHGYGARKIINIYRSRMQIEEGFRDTKSESYGIGISKESRSSFLRASNLLLIAALSNFVLWIIASVAQENGWECLVSVTSSGARKKSYSIIHLSRLIIKHVRVRIPSRCIKNVASWVKSFNQEVIHG